jgi:hypothetical protein
MLWLIMPAGRRIAVRRLHGLAGNDGSMLPSRLRIGAIAAWLGVVALGFNALVPVHLAFDLAHALAPDREEGAAADHDFVRCLLSLLTGHHDEDADHSSNKAGHHNDCAVCGAIGTLAGFAPTAVVPLAAPVSAYAPLPPAIEARALHPSPAAAYHSRAPPLA